MPTKAKGRSEYKTNFKWLESFRDKKFKPSPEQMAPPAGMGSVFSSISVEPPLQHKKRVEGPPSSLSVNFDEGKYQACDDFALLGKQQKFADNVRYGLRPAKASKLEDKKLDLEDKQLDVNNNANRDLPPPPKQMKMEATQTHARRKLDLTEARLRKESKKENLTPTSPPPAPRKPKPSDQQVMKEGLRDKNLSDVLPKDKAVTRNKVNEFVQTNMDKGVALSSQEAPADYNLRYKAGVAPPRVSRKASEYQKQYSWKQGVPASPLLSAEQIVYNNNAQISPAKKAPLLKKTEYQSQFKEYKIPEAVSFAPQPSQEPQYHRGRSKTQMKRSKSVGAALSPDRMVAAGSLPVTSPDDPRLLRESRDNSPIPKVPIPHGKLKRGTSEYKSNFKSPTHFSYEDGAWKNAAPPHLFQNKNVGGGEKTASGAEEAPPLSNWFAEVLELRRRANEYKRRAQGTHFSREHLVQLLAQQTDFWDVDSTCSSSRAAALDALALEPAKAAAELPRFSKQQRNKNKMSVDRVSHMAVRGDSPEPSESITVATQTRKPIEKKGKNRKKTKMAWQEKMAPEGEMYDRVKADEQLNTNQNASCQAQLTEEGQEIDELELEEQGRLPTPVLQQKQKTSRHHLDRTTPSVGGILLSAPAQLSDRSDNTCTAETVSECQSSPKLKFSTEKLLTSPILGKPTPDTHPLRDDDAESDHVMETQYIPSPPVPAVSPAKADRSAKAQQRRLNANIPPTIDERMGQTYHKDRGNFHIEDLPLCNSQDVEDDVLSVSAMSIASSSSLASEVYERARRRRDEFWGKPRQ